MPDSTEEAYHEKSQPSDTHTRLNRPEAHPTTWPGAATAVTKYSMSKGVFPWVIVGAVLLVIAWRIPKGVLRTVVIDHIFGSSLWGLAGWVLLVCAIGGWSWHVRRVDQRRKEENKRLGKEKTRLQRKMTEQAKRIGELEANQSGSH